MAVLLTRSCCSGTVSLPSLFLLMLFLPLSLAAQSASDFPAHTSMPPPGGLAGITMENYPRVDGSTSTMLLGQLLAARVLNIPAEVRRVDPASWEATTDARINPSEGKMLPAVLVFPMGMEVGRIKEFLTFLKEKAAHTGTNPAYMNLIEGRSDLLLAGREPSEDELAAARNKGVVLDVRPVANDAFVFIVNHRNPVDSLSLDQIRSIFTGTIRNWKDVGGEDRGIYTITRNRNSGSEELMRKLVMKDLQVPEENMQNRKIMMGGVINDVVSTATAIGYTLFFYDQALNPRLESKLLAINGVKPDIGTIASGRYPLIAPVYLVTRQGISADSPTAKLRDWLLGFDGQQTVAASGLVPLGR